MNMTNKRAVQIISALILSVLVLLGVVSALARTAALEEKARLADARTAAIEEKVASAPAGCRPSHTTCDCRNRNPINVELKGLRPE